LLAGVARHATHFFCFAKKNKQKKAILVAASLRFAAGNLVSLEFAVSRLSAKPRATSN
jgi:hypothetical protein